VPTIRSGCRPVQIKLAVEDKRRAVEFYPAAFGLRYEVIRRTEDEDYSDIQFGEYGQGDFFLLSLLDDPAHTDQPGATTFGLLADDLDIIHTQALGAGATEAVAPHDPEGMPRCSAVKDPDDNWIRLYQSWPGLARLCRVSCRVGQGASGMRVGRPAAYRPAPSDTYPSMWTLLSSKFA
jgi:predicted enzyme related to lactoylglutathione lyase